MSGNISQTLDFEALKERLGNNISTSAQKGLVKTLWGGTDLPVDMSPYFEYYYSQHLRRLMWNGYAGFPVESHLHIVLIAKRILSGGTREEVFRDVAGAALSESAIANINYGIDMCASLLVMTEIELIGHVGLSGLTAVPWKKGPLTDALAYYFCPQITLQSDRPKLGKIFSSRNLSRMAGIEIRWTTNLADHLRLGDNDQVVFIFHCASFLQFQKSLSSSPFPESFLQETLDTLALLFPSSDKETTRWLKGKREIDPQLSECGSLRTRERRLENFHYWHDQLVILKQAFDESSPRTISHWWFDRRDGVKWYTFWAAIFFFAVSALFSIVQIVEGGLQVYLAYQSA